jgi:magnesium-transporting ATPase (P-type)
LPKLRPEKSIFNWPFWISVVGQAAVLLTCMQLCLHLSRKYSHDDDLEITNEQEFEPTFRNSMMFLYELVSMFCISIFNHEGEPFMQALTDKKGHLKYILAPLVVSFLITLDVSDDLNSFMQINLDSKYEYVSNYFLRFLLII